MRTVLACVTAAALLLTGCGGDSELSALTPGATASASPSPTESESLSANPTATPTSSPTETATPTASPTGTATLEPTPSPELTPEATSSPAATPTIAPATPVVPAATAAPPVASGVTANIQGFGYPYELQVTAGTTVTWVNLDAEPHDVMAYDGSWSSVILAQGQAYSRAFSVPGRYPYTCTVHPYMQAAVVVQ